MTNVLLFKDIIYWGGNEHGFTGIISSDRSSAGNSPKAGNDWQQNGFITNRSLSGADAYHGNDRKRLLLFEYPVSGRFRQSENALLSDGVRKTYI